MTRLKHARNLDHRRLARSDRCKSLHRIYPREIARGDIEPSVAQRSLERVHRNPLAGALHGKAVSKCVGVDPTTQAAALLERRGHFLTGELASDHGQQRTRRQSRSATNAPMRSTTGVMGMPESQGVWWQKVKRCPYCGSTSHIFGGKS